MGLRSVAKKRLEALRRGLGAGAKEPDGKHDGVLKDQANAASAPSTPPIANPEPQAAENATLAARKSPVRSAIVETHSTPPPAATTNQLASPNAALNSPNLPGRNRSEACGDLEGDKLILPSSSERLHEEASLPTGATVEGWKHGADGPQMPAHDRHPPKHSQSHTAETLWDRAYAALRTENQSLVETYEKLLSKELPATGSKSNTYKNTAPDQAEESLDEVENRIDHSNVLERQEQMKTIINSGLRRVDERKIKYTIAGHEYVLQDQITQAAGFVQWAKGLIDETVKASPEASLAWAGVCVILPLLTQPSVAEQANRDGFTYVTARMRFYVALEPLLLPQSHNQAVSIPENLKEAFEADIVDLYRHVLEFQVRSVLRFYRSRSGNLGRDLVHREDWAAMLSKVKERETTLDNNFKHISGVALRQELEELNSTADESLESMQAFLSVTTELRDIAKEHLQVQKNIFKRSLSDEEKKCHQLFRLTTGKNNTTYEWYKSRVEARIEGTCQWFLNHENFQTWLKQDSGPLLVSADPGCGKSVLAKYLIDQGLPQSAAICYFFFKDQDQMTVNQALCALLHQLFSHQPSLIRHALPEYSKNGERLINITTSLWDILEKAGQDLQDRPVIMVLDALDECAESDLQDLTRMLTRLFHRDRWGCRKIKCLMTSRPYEHIVSEFHELVGAFPYIRIPGEAESEAISQEVNRVITYQVNKLAFSTLIKDHLQKRLLGIQHRTYLWVYLVFDYLRREGFKKTPKGVEDAIATLPESVNEAYEKILNRSKKPSNVQKALSIILAASRPLTLAEMSVAMNIEISSRSMRDLDLESQEDFESSLRSWCGLFVSIYHGKVYFLHQTAREFLLADSPANVPPERRWHHSITARQAHMVLAEACVVHLDFFNSDVVLTDGSASSQYINSSTFLDYSAENWAAHFREAHFSDDAAIVRYALRICNTDSKSYSTWFEIYRTVYRVYHKHSASLGVAAYFGHEAVVRLLLKEGADFEAKDEDDWTPLSLAARKGHEAAVVKLLLKEGADFEAKDKYGRTPLLQAAGRGHEAVVKLLLKEGADFEAKDKDGWTPLLQAAGGGHEAVVKLLLKEGADFEAKDEDGHEAVAKLLLKEGADFEAKDEDGQTPLSQAASEGHEAVGMRLSSSCFLRKGLISRQRIKIVRRHYL
ncbi:hypothetical protein QBC33DRAFT_522720 [Phialemonium atrogriseum]|uniref:NWD NACHT-NTPase N-terminal domain-containing protein n=1 Tax=Phialemonium atrogriseum TaxID=1093897 RepID=A0AAJ0CAB4_9PEZI|nr:uncharacterized protein QBC33DRAFT_522720 [Phialemonium atrogriseum]KAK1772870.1 hypothetical protein QBC33DRAFT_522720 [Phialemonium atrogriseum]